MKKIVKWLHTQRILVFAVLVMALLGIGATMALFTDTEAAVNTFKVGKNTITVEEEPVGLTKKNIGITNTGTVPVYVRMQVNVPDQIKYVRSDGTEGILEVKKTYHTDYKADWIDLTEEDGFYYYRNEVKEGDTVYLFSEVSLIDSDTGEAPKISKEQMDLIKDMLDITVYGESVQTTGFSDSVMAQIDKQKASKDDNGKPNGNPAKVAFEAVTRQ